MKKYHFVTPSNQKIVLDDQYTYRDFLTVEDLKYLFTVKMRLYSMEMFEIVNSKKEMLDYSTKLSDFPENHVFHILHIDIKKSATLDTKESEKVQVIVVNNTIKEPETVVEVEKVEVEKVENEKENKENKDIFIEKESETDTKKEKEVQVIVEKNTIKEPETVVHFENFENDTKNEKIEEKEKVESKKSCVIS